MGGITPHFSRPDGTVQRDPEERINRNWNVSQSAGGEIV